MNNPHGKTYDPGRQADDFSPYACYRIPRTVYQPHGLMPQFRYGGKVFGIQGGYDPDVFGWKILVLCSRLKEALYVEAGGAKFHILEVTL